MVRAILQAKRQTRRVIKPQPEMVAFAGEPVPAFGPKLCCPGMLAVSVSVFNAGGNDGLVKCPYGRPGDHLWVKETFAPVGTTGIGAHVRYKADGLEALGAYGAHLWTPSIHMPRWASRLTLEITNVRVERLQDISAADCKAEGLVHEGRGIWSCPGTEKTFDEGFKGYRHLWDSLAPSEYQWAVNPWVWVVEFERVRT